VPAGAAVPMRFFRTPPAGGAAPCRLLYDADTPRTLVTPKHYAYIKVAEGCDYACAFCIIRRCAGTTAAARPSRSSRRPGTWPIKACASCC